MVKNVEDVSLFVPRLMGREKGYYAIYAGACMGITSTDLFEMRFHLVFFYRLC